MAYKDDILYILYKFSRARQYDMVSPSSGEGILLEPSESRVGFVISNPYPSSMQISVDRMDSNDTGIVLQPMSGPHFFDITNVFGAVRQRWHWRSTGLITGSRWSVVELLSNLPL